MPNSHTHHSGYEVFFYLFRRNFIIFVGGITMHIAICDNELSFTTSLADAVKDYFAKYDLSYSELKTYTNGYDLLADYTANSTLDILFLDIDMPEISGLELAHKLRLAHSEALIVFVTSHPEFMAPSFQVETFDFLTKPISASDVAHVLKRCIKKYEERYAKLVIKIPKGTAVIYLNTLLYVASNKHYLEFMLDDHTKIHSLMKLSQLEELLAGYPQFVRIHQSYIVNLDYVKEVYRDNLLFLADYHHIVSTLPISRKHAEKVKEKFLLYHF